MILASPIREFTKKLDQFNAALDDAKTSISQLVNQTAVDGNAQLSVLFPETTNRLQCPYVNSDQDLDIEQPTASDRIGDHNESINV